MQASTTLAAEVPSLKTVPPETIATSEVPYSPPKTNETPHPVSIWVPVIASIFAIILGLINLVRSILTDQRLTSSQREADFNASVGTHRTKLLQYLSEIRRAVEAVKSAPENQIQPAQLNLVTLLGDKFEECAATFSDMRLAHYDWAKAGEDSDIPEDLQEVIIDNVFVFVDYLAPSEDAPPEELARLPKKVADFTCAIDEALRRLKVYRDTCCPRRKPARRFIGCKRG